MGSPTSSAVRHQGQQLQPQSPKAKIEEDQARGSTNIRWNNPSSWPPKRSPTPSPPTTFTNNTSMQTELDKIVLLDHCYDTRDQDDSYLPENINRDSLIQRIRAIRSSGQIQYRIPKRRKKDSTRKRKAEGDAIEDGELSELSDELVTVTRQKRVKRAPIRPRNERDSSYNRRHREPAKEGQSRNNEPDPNKELNPSTEALDLPETAT